MFDILNQEDNELLIGPMSPKKQKTQRYDNDDYLESTLIEPIRQDVNLNYFQT